MRSLLFVVVVLVGGGSAAFAADFPNILVLLADDLGYGDLGCYNATSKVPTPHIDRLAAEGMRLTDAHSPATVCTPSRYSLLTGRMCFRTGAQGVLTGVDGPLIEPGRLTLPRLLQAKGYDTACVGKWHVGMTFFQADGKPVAASGGDLEKVRLVDFSRPFTNGPLDAGFDYFFGTACCPTTDWLYAYLENDRVVEPPTTIVRPDAKNWLEYEFFRTGLKAPGFEFREADLEFLEKSKAFLEEHARERRDRPFFLYHATQAIHLPALPAQQFVGQTNAGPLGDFIAEFDQLAGELLKTLERLKLADNTLVILTSDNGPEIVAARMREDHDHDSARPWRGLKRDNWEGGHRVPFIARWPGRIPAGTTSDETLCLTDILATCAAIVGEKLPPDAGEDSFDMLPALVGEKTDAPLRPFVIHQTMTNKLAIRSGRWKFLDHRGAEGNDYAANPMLRKYQLPDTEPDAPGQLYDLVNDPGETRNVFAKHPDVVTRLHGQLEQAKRVGRSTPLHRD
jgi:arylsulfatase A-like enzyme